MQSGNDSLQVQEQRRHQYLKAMGISSWLPRRALPHAAPSPGWVSSFVYPSASEQASPGGSGIQERVASVPATPSPSAGRAAALAAAGALSAELSAPDSAPSRPTPEHQPARSAGRRVAQPEVGNDHEQTAPTSEASATDLLARDTAFHLIFTRVGDLLLVDSLPLQLQGRQAALQRMEQQVARALGLGQVAEKRLELRWPPFAAQHLAQNATEAQHAVNHLLQGLHRERPLARVLLLGTAAAQWLLERDEGLEALRGITFTLLPGVRARCSYSLSELMQLPELKQDLWQDLQPLLTETAATTTP